MQIKGYTALVTGGAVRIGRAICLELAAHGVHVVVHYRHSAGPAEALVGELEARGVRAFCVRGALGTGDACGRLFAAARELAGAIDVLVNNASIFERQPFLEADDEDYERHWHVNCLVPVHLTRAFSRQPESQRADGQRVVINLLDRRVAEAPSDCMPYLLSKKALAAFTRSAAHALGPGIRVNGVAPGAVLPANEAGAADKPTPPFEARASAEDVARAVVTLVESDGVSGHITYVGGSPESRRRRPGA